MIDYNTYHRIHFLYEQQRMGFSQIGRELDLDPETVSKYARMTSYPRRGEVKKASKLDPFKPTIQRLIERHGLSCVQIFQRLQMEEGYTGGLSILKDYVRIVRPVRHPAFLTLAFAPGEAAQVDWGSAGTINLGKTRRRLSFFVMVLCYSRMAYVEFTCGEGMEHFLACHRNALEFFGGSPACIQIDNLKTGVLRHVYGENAVFNKRYLDFAAHYGFIPKACNVRAAHEKGRVECGVGYVKISLLKGLEIPDSLGAMNGGAFRWRDAIANVRIHGTTKQRPVDMFETEKRALLPLPEQGADTAITRLVRISNQFRATLDTNRYSVPSIYASQRLTMVSFADRICFYHANNLVASHPRSYERNRDFENPDHVKELLDHKRRARDSKWLMSFYALSPQADYYYQQLSARSLNARMHVNKIVALSQTYGTEKVAAAMDDAIASSAFSSDYIVNILQQRARFQPEPGPLHLTRRLDLLDLELSPADLSVYDNEKDQ